MTNRIPIIALAFIGLHISRYLTAYQLGHIEAVWDPFFMGGADPKNGTEEIITSSLSEAWPVPDAGLGAMTYGLEILTGLLGARNRWRTMPWLVALFGMMIVPLGVVSLTFIIIQPILLGTWCALCLIAAAAMLLQIPYSFDELIATGQFLLRRKRAGQSLLRVFFLGDTDEQEGPNRFTGNYPPQQAPSIKEMMTSGVGLPWNLALCLLIGLWLMFTRLTLDNEGSSANADHLLGALILTVTVCALAEVARSLRYLNFVLGAALIIVAFVLAPNSAVMVNQLACGAAVIALSFPRGRIRGRHGTWQRMIV